MNIECSNCKSALAGHLRSDLDLVPRHARLKRKPQRQIPQSAADLLQVEIAVDPPADLEGFDPSLTLDLSPVGGPAALPLTTADGRRFQVSTRITPPGNGRYDLEVTMRHGFT